MGKTKSPMQWGVFIEMKKNILPIDAFREEILKCIEENPVTVIVAETGAGKSTQVPQYLLEEGYDLVVTQPRRLAARSVAARVAEEWGEELGQTIGYRTAVDRVDSPATRCLFCTDGLALVRELLGQNKGVLVLDEVHEWNENMEVLVAWTKSMIEEGSTMKVVLMSATLEAEKLSAFFNNAPIISVPGRNFEVVNREAGREIEDDVALLVSEGRNVLVFQPGHQEINETIAKLVAKNVSAVILPLHGQLEPKDQAKCFAHYGKPKIIVSTNVAQTSVTIDDVDAVVDSGLERRIELVDGVEGLYLKPISLADAKQRKGRAGRVKAGIYIDHCPNSNRPDFPVAEIMRKRLDQTVLRLAIAGFDMESMEFFHQPAKSDIHDAHKSLIGLGCMTADGKITQIGRLVNKLPVSVKYGRMLVEANRLGVVDEILTVAAIMEMGGITVPPPSNNRPDRPDWRKMVPEEKESDIMGQLKVWQLARTMSETQMKESGISMRNYYRAKEIRQHLSEALRNHFRFGTNSNRENILKAVCAGMVDHLYKNQYGSYINGDDTSRDLGSASVINGADWVVGNPFDLQIQTRRGSMTLHLIELASKVEPAWLAEIAPHLVSKKVEKLYWKNEMACVVEDHLTIFNGTEIARVAKPAPWSTEAFKIFVNAMMSSYTSSEVVNELYRINTEVLNQYQNYYVRSGGTIQQLDNDTIRAQYIKVLENDQITGFIKFENLLEKEVSKAALRINLSQIISQEEINSIEFNNPLGIGVDGKEFSVTYKNNYGNFIAEVEVTEDFIRKTKMEKLLLPNGRELEIICNGYRTKTITEMINKLEGKRIAEAWSVKKSELEKTSWIQNPEEISPFLTKFLKPIEITKTRDGGSESIFGYLSLYSDSDPDFQIRLRESIEEAEKETQIGLQRLIKKFVRNIFVIPQEEPWYNYGITDLGNALQNRLNEIKNVNIEDLNPENISEKIEMIKTQIESIKDELQKKHEEAQALIVLNEELLKGASTEVVDEESEIISSDKEEIEDEFYDESEVSENTPEIEEEAEEDKEISFEDLQRLKERFM